ncbi:MAG: hypothetical protein F6K26_22100 [Moorea sp. SIO2I5]|nr:hypothetical protein [Moorena sp. SIO2I5]
MRRISNIRELLFSSQVDLMSLVVCGIQPSVNAADRAKASELSVSTTALYNKLQGIEPKVSQALIRETVPELIDLILPDGSKTVCSAARIQTENFGWYLFIGNRPSFGGDSLLCSVRPYLGRR